MLSGFQIKINLALELHERKKKLRNEINTFTILPSKFIFIKATKQTTNLNLTNFGKMKNIEIERET